MFDRKNVFFEKSHYKKNENDGTEQTQQEYARANAVRKQLVQKKVF
jgi:hypothetical protein